MNTFNPMVVLGISNKKYYIDLKEKKELQDHSFSPTKTDESNAEEAIEVSEEASDLNREKVKSDEIDEPKKNDKESIDSSDNNKEIATGAPAESKDFAEEAAWMPLESEDDVEDATWESIGIENPDDVCIDLNQFDMEVQVAPRQKKFNVSAFKNEMRTSYLGAEKLIIMKAIYDMHGIIDSFAAFLADIEEDDFNAAAEKLIKAGYIKKHTVTRNHFEKYDSLYDLTPNGIKAFNTKGSADVLKHKIIKDDNYAVFVPNNITATLSRVVFYRAIGLNYKVSHTRNLTAVANILSEESFLTENVDNATGKNYLLSGIVSNDPDAYQNFISNIIKNFDHPEKFVIAGLDQKISKNIALWVITKLPKEYDESHIYYFAADSSTLYSVLDDSEVELPSFSELMESEENVLERKDDYADDNEDLEYEAELINDEREYDPLSENDDIPKAQTVSEIFDNEEAAVNKTAETRKQPATTKHSGTETSPNIKDYLKTTQSNGAQINNKVDNEFKQNVEANKVIEGGPERTEVPVNTEPEEFISDTLQFPESLNKDLVNHYIAQGNAPTDEELYKLIIQLLNADNNPFGFNDDSCVIQGSVLAKAAACNPKRRLCTSLYKKLLLATDLSLDDHSYTSTELSTVFDDDDEAMKLCAYLYALLVPSMAYDFGLRNQAEVYLHEYDLFFPSYPSVKPLLSKLVDINKRVPMGFNDAVIGLLGSATENERFINDLRTQARDLCTLPNIGLKNFYSKLFGESSDLYTCMRLIADNTTDEYEYVQMVLEDFADSNENIYSISEEKIENHLEKNRLEYSASSPGDALSLEGGKRNQVVRHYHSRLNLMKTWIEHIRMTKDHRVSLDQLKMLRNDIIKLASEANEELNKEAKYYSVVQWMLSHIKKRLMSSPIKPHTEFIEFLYTGIIPQDTDCIPIINPNMDQIKYYEPWRNVLRHMISPIRTLEEAKESILDDLSLSFDNLHQYELIGAAQTEFHEGYHIDDAQIKDALKAAEDNTTRFKETVELAYTYDRITETDKENLSAIMTQFKGRFFERQDFGMWKQFLLALEKNIDEISATRKSELRNELQARWDKIGRDNESPILQEAEKLLEIDNNFAVAEEYINRFDNGENDISDELQVVMNDPDSFNDFLSDDVFEKLYRECADNAGKKLKSFGWDYVLKNVPDSWTNRLKEDSKNLLFNWPTRRNYSTPDQIKKLFEIMGFNVNKAEKIQSANEEIYRLRIKPTEKSLIDYRHPIAAFGTQAKSPLNVVILYGNNPAQQLVDKITSLNLGGIAIVLLDSAIDRAVRRQVCEIFHTRTSGHNRFIVIDRVLALYLALHQSTERLPVLLKCTLPYTTYQPFVRDGGSTADEMFCGRMSELNTIIDPNGACVVYGGRQLGKTALLERAESRCHKPDNKAYAVYCNIINCKTEKELVTKIQEEVNKKTNIDLSNATSIKELSDRIDTYFRNGKIVSMLLLLDEADNFLASIADEKYVPLQPLIDLKRVTKNSFKFVIAGLHNVCRAEKATEENGVFGQLGTPLCVKPLSPTDALQLLSRPLRYLGFQIDRYPHLETILTNTNYYPGILQFFGYMLVETLTGHYGKYYRAVDGNPPFTLQDDQLGAVMNSADLNRSIRDKFRWSLELDPRYFMIARCIALLYYFKDEDSTNWLGYSIKEILDIAKDYDIICLRQENITGFKNLLDEMVDMGILSQPADKLYRMRRSSFINIIGPDFDAVHTDITTNNKEEDIQGGTGME